VLKKEIEYSNESDESFENDPISSEEESDVANLESSYSSDSDFSSSEESQMQIDSDDKWKLIPEESSQTLEDGIYSNISKIMAMYQNPIYYFNLYFCGKFYEFILENSLLYYVQASKKKINETKLRSVISKVNIQRYIYCVLNMGFIKLPRTQDYWEKNSLANSSFFNSIISRRNFEYVNKFIHFNDNSKLTDLKEDVCIESVPLSIFSIQNGLHTLSLMEILHWTSP
jgi:hypothetical protein